MFRFVLCCAVLTMPLLFSGCEDDNDDAPAPEAAAAAPAATDESAADPHFPDGLHPDSAGDSTIAGVFARNISAVEGGTVVCLGDSITHGGYPGPLSGMFAGMSVVDQGTDGEKSSGGAGRVGGVLSQYNPAYLCILYGANDIIGIHASPDEICANLESIINAARNSGATPIIATLTPMSGERAEYADDARATSAAIRALAGRTGTALADLEAAF